MIALLLLAACSGGDSKPEDTAPYVGCRGDPVLTVTSPEEGATYTVGEEVPFSGTGTSSMDDPLVLLWAVDGEVEVIGASGSWTASGPGSHLVTFQGEDECGLTQVDLTIRVEAGPDTGPDDTGADDTGDTGDTGDDTDTADPLEPSVTPFGPEVGLPAALWYGLSVAPDGTVWGATSAGLVHLDPDAGTTRIYGVADGLLTDTPTAVLAHSDGTVWVGHVGTVDRQGEQVSVGGDGTLTVLRTIDFTESAEILSVFRLGEQPYGLGAGDVWMGTNEGLCVFDADVERFAEHAHPTHPHGNSEGVAFGEDGDVWNGDAYQLSRWRYSNDGDLSPSADLLETVATWPVQVEEPVDITDLHVDGRDLWVTSDTMGIARVAIGGDPGTSAVSLFAEPLGATAVRADGDGNVWIGTTTGLWRWDGVALAEVASSWVPAEGVAQIAVDPATVPATVWMANGAGLLRVVGAPG